MNPTVAEIVRHYQASNLSADEALALIQRSGFWARVLMDMIVKELAPVQLPFTIVTPPTAPTTETLVAQDIAEGLKALEVVAPTPSDGIVALAQAQAALDAAVALDGPTAS